MAKRKVVWLEIFADDRGELAGFYTELFGFDFKDYPDMNYTTLSTGNGDEGFGIGIGQRTEENPGVTTIYIESGDLEADLAAIKGKGGTVVEESMEVPGVGRMAFFKDPGGNFMALGDFTPPQELAAGFSQAQGRAIAPDPLVLRPHPRPVSDCPHPPHPVIIPAEPTT